MCAVFVIVLVVFPLSIGPAATVVRLSGNKEAVRRVGQVVYWPLHKVVPAAGRVYLKRWAEWWHGDWPSDK
jgi:hypothetical protein